MKNQLYFHWPLALVLALFVVLAVAFSVNTPLGEAPDEPAHFSYAQFIAKKGRLPATLTERNEAGYKAVWPPLYHLLVAAPIAAVGDAPPTRLKAVGDSPRRLIPTNGQTLAAFIHTEDEAWPWQGIVLAWHLARLVSVALSAAAVAVTYAIAWRVTGQQVIALAAAALHAFNPQVLFIGSVINDDNLLILLTGLIILALLSFPRPTLAQAFGLGLLLGLATLTKYNALPLWGVALLWLGWQSSRDAGARARGEKSGQPANASPFAIRHSPIGSFVYSLSLILLGAALTAGGWFAFIWRNFNQVESLGLLRGSLAALAAGSSGVSGATLQQLGGEGTLNLPPPALWLDWSRTFFKSYWGLFGGSGSIELPAWAYGLLALLCLLALGALLGRWLTNIRQRGDAFNTVTVLLALLPLSFLLLPLLRFASSGVITETAQGRHLFPALPAIALALTLGSHQLARKSQIANSKLRITHYVLHFTFFAFTVTLALLALPLIRAAYPPPIPLTTTLSAEAATSSFRAPLAPGIELTRILPGPTTANVLPLALLWQANSTPPEDFLIDITVRDAAGADIGGWRGHPIGGRYPTRAWDEGDTLRDVIPVPLLPGPAGMATLRLSLLDAAGQPAAPAAEWPLSLPARPAAVAAGPSPLRADGLPAAAPFSYRGTLSFSLPGQTEPPRLIAPDGRAFAPATFLSGGIAHFIVGADWPSGSYQINSQFTIPNAQFTIQNRPRQFTPPPMQQPLNANFGDRLTLLGYDLPQRRLQPGDSFPLMLHLQANRTMGENLAIFNHLLDAEAVQRGGADRIPQQYYTTLLWVPGEIVSDSYRVPVDAAAPPGIYWLDVGLYPTQNPEFSLPLMVNGQPIERNSVAIGPLKVGGPPPGVTVPQAAPQTTLNANFADEITLLGYTQQPEKIEPKNSTNTTNSMNLTLYWQANTLPAADYTVFVHVVGADGALLAQADGPPANGAYPSSLWDAGEIIVDERLVPLPPEEGYSVRVGLYRPDNGERLPVAGASDGAVVISEEEP